MNCLDCPKTISTQSVTGRCRVCAIHFVNATDPHIKARRADGWRKRLLDPDMIAQRKDVGRRNARQQIAWCPRAYEAEYQRLRRDKALGADEARRITLDQMANDTRGLDPLAAAIKMAGLAA